MAGVARRGRAYVNAYSRHDSRVRPYRVLRITIAVNTTIIFFDIGGEKIGYRRGS